MVPVAAWAAAPTVRACASVASAATAINPGIPTGTTTGDLMLMACETRDNESTSCSSNCDAGWTEIASVEGHTAGGGPGTGSRAQVFYQVSDASPIAPQMADAGNHTICKICSITTGTWSNTNGGVPYDALTTESRNTASSTLSLAGSTTTGTDCLIYASLTGELDNSTNTQYCWHQANTSLGSVSVKNSSLQNNGDGGILCLQTGPATAGTAQAQGTWTMDTQNPEFTTQASVGGEITFAVCNSYPAATRRRAMVVN